MFWGWLVGLTYQQHLKEEHVGFLPAGEETQVSRNSQIVVLREFGEYSFRVDVSFTRGHSCTVDLDPLLSTCCS